jgi:hypothetical protein
LPSRFQFPKGTDQASAKANNEQDKAERLRNISHWFRAVFEIQEFENAIVEPSGFNSRVQWLTVWLASHLLAKPGRQIAAHSFELCWLHHAIKRRYRCRVSFGLIASV